MELYLTITPEELIEKYKGSIENQNLHLYDTDALASKFELIESTRERLEAEMLFLVAEVTRRGL